MDIFCGVMEADFRRRACTHTHTLIWSKSGSENECFLLRLNNVVLVYVPKPAFPKLWSTILQSDYRKQNGNYKNVDGVSAKLSISLHPSESDASQLLLYTVCNNSRFDSDHF